MKSIKLRTSIVVGFLCVIALLSASVSLFGFYIVKTYVVGETQKKVNMDLKMLRLVYDDQIERVKMSFEIATPAVDLEGVKSAAKLDFLQLIPFDKAKESKKAIIQEALRSKDVVGGTGLIQKEELIELGSGLYQKAAIELKPTPRAHPNPMKTLEKAMAREYAKPFLDTSGNVVSVLYGGRLLNRNFELIDQIAETVFEKKIYDSKPVGTVTIFLDDTRIATNVLNAEGERAIGTIVSDSVYQKVVEQGGRWVDRAFVVTDWYLTAYEPIRDIRGNIIGILYVGILEKPFAMLQKNLFLAFIGIIALVSSIAIILSFILSGFLTRSFEGMLHATKKLADGDLKSQVAVHTILREVNELTEAFNHMAARLAEREKSLAESNEKLTSLNQIYLDMIGFVSHELKGIIYTASLNVYTLAEQYPGPLNPKQKEILSAVNRSLDYLSAMVRNFLSLSQIEKGQLVANRSEIYLKENIFDDVVETFLKQAAEKQIQMLNKIQPKLMAKADGDLIKIVGNNLVSNAIRYGSESGTVIVSAREKDGLIEVEVYNDGTPITAENAEKLFRRFSRLPGEALKQKGTGLGLFITKEILTAHGGGIRLETKPFGNSFIFTIKKGI
jgi:two-component system NtrC family sensor kinase